MNYMVTMTGALKDEENEHKPFPVAAAVLL